MDALLHKLQQRWGFGIFTNFTFFSWLKTVDCRFSNILLRYSIQCRILSDIASVISVICPRTSEHYFLFLMLSLMQNLWFQSQVSQRDLRGLWLLLWQNLKLLIFWHFHKVVWKLRWNLIWNHRKLLFLLFISLELHFGVFSFFIFNDAIKNLSRKPVWQDHWKKFQ